MGAFVDGKVVLLLTSLVLIWLWPRTRFGSVVGGDDALLADAAPVDESSAAADGEPDTHSSRHQERFAALQADGDRSERRRQNRTHLERVQLDGSGWPEAAIAEGEEADLTQNLGVAGAQDDSGTFSLHSQASSKVVSLHSVAIPPVSSAASGVGADVDVVVSRGSMTASGTLTPAQRPGNLPAKISRLPWIRWPLGALAELAVWSGVGPRVADYWNATHGTFAQDSLSGGMGWQQALVLRCLWCTVALAAALLLLLATYDTARKWRQRHQLKLVQEKLRRANEAFLGLHGSNSLCPCCVEFIPASTNSVITFLCGHTFHVQCANSWYKRHANSQTDPSPGHCPICEGLPSQGAHIEPNSYCMSEEGSEIGGRLPDCARLFSLQCLAESYPKIITKEWLEKLSLQRAGILFSEKPFCKEEFL